MFSLFQIKSASNKDKPKDKKSKCAPELVQDPPIRRLLASAHIPMQSLVHGSPRVTTVCDFGPVHADSDVEATQTLKVSLRDAFFKLNPLQRSAAEAEEEKHEWMIS